MNTNDNIHKLWEYLNIRDNEIMIVRTHNGDREEYLTIRKTDGGLCATASDTFPEPGEGTEFTFVQYLGSDGKHHIPSVDELIREEEDDY